MMRVLLILGLVCSCGGSPWVGRAVRSDADGTPLSAVVCSELECVCYREQEQRRCGPAPSEAVAWKCCDG